MKLFLLSAGIVLSVALMADFAVSQANDERTHARFAFEAKCLDTNTAALPEVQRMCAAESRRAYPER